MLNQAPYLADTENVDTKLQDWGEAYKALCALITTKLPRVKHVDLYYGQETMVDSDGNWMPFRAPAVFLEFNTVQADDIGGLSQQLTMDITAHLYMETVQDTDKGSAGQRRALEFVELMRQLHQVLHNASGDHFGPLSRVGMRRVEAPPYVYMYAQTYRCVMLDNSTVPQYEFVVLGAPAVEPGEA